MLDYLRFGTFNSAAHAILMSCLPRESRKATHWLQYAGERGEHTFTGAGDQRGKRHFLTHCSGELAEQFAAAVLLVHDLDRFDDIRCRRIDLKRDILATFPAEDVADTLRQTHTNVTTISSSDGWTVYGNQRSGDFMIRIYRKHDRALTRCEFECKGKLADEVWSWIKVGHPKASIYSWLLDRAKMGDLADKFRNAEDQQISFERHRIAADQERRIEWMFDAFSGIEKLIMDHQTRDRCLDALLVFSSRMKGSIIAD